MLFHVKTAWERNQYVKGTLYTIQVYQGGRNQYVKVTFYMTELSYDTV
jgi:hypothetical protein